MDIAIGTGSGFDWPSFTVSVLSAAIAFLSTVAAWRSSSDAKKSTVAAEKSASISEFALEISKKTLEDSRRQVSQAMTMSFLREREGVVQMMTRLIEQLNATHVKLKNSSNDYDALNESRKGVLAQHKKLFTKHLPELDNEINEIKKVRDNVTELSVDMIDDVDVFDITVKLIEARSSFYSIQTECLNDLSIIETDLDAFAADLSKS